MRETHMKKVSVLAIFSHPDDAEQFCGGTLLLLAQAGCRIIFCVLTDGACGSKTLADSTIIAIRHKEMVTGATLLGAELVSLGLRDGCVSCDLETTQRLVAVIREYQPTVIFTHPTVDYMTDHAHTGQLVLWAVPEATHPNFSVTGSHRALKLQPHVYHTDPQGLIGLDGQIVRVNTIVDITTTIEAKLKAFASHASQMDFLKMKTQSTIDSVEKTKRWAITRGQQVRCMYGEGFTKQLLEQYPRTNILKELLGDKTFTI